MSYLISVPVWSPGYLQTFAESAYPSIRAAVQNFDEPVKFLIHTDNPDFIRNLITEFPLEVRQIVGGATYVTLQESHSDAINAAAMGDRVILLNADIVVSRNLLTGVKKYLDQGKNAVVTTGIRTRKGDEKPPIGASSEDLLEWAWSHKHQIIEDLVWGRGESMLPTNVFFERGGTVILHAFHLHPVAIVKPMDGNMPFISTIDGDLLDRFDRGTIHIVTDPADLSMCEISDPGKRFPIRGEPMNAGHIAGCMIGRASELHKWQFTHRIIVRGDPKYIEEMAVVESILAMMPGSSFLR